MEVGTHDQNQNNTVLAILAFCFKIAGLFTVSEFFNLLLTGLSIVSVTLLIIINWKKAMDVIFKKKRKK